MRSGGLGTLLDTGPLVALIDANDRHHEACREALTAVDGPLIATWPCVTEALYLVRRQGGASFELALFNLLMRPEIQFFTLGKDDVPRLVELINRYHDLPMDFADAPIVLASERLAIGKVLTVDQHFRAYRIQRTGYFDVLP